MELIAVVVSAVFAGLYTGFQATVTVLVYPQFARVPPGAFRSYHAAHQRLITVVVGPLFAGLGLGAALVVVVPGPVEPGWSRIAVPILVGVILGLTGFGAVPCHRTLSAGFDATVLHRLRAIDGLRLVAALGLLVVGVLTLVQR